MEKYYVPEKEEFHVGFEFEVYLGMGNWEKFISEIKYDEFSNPYVELIDASIDHRVKYLDRGDIESLGFEAVDLANDIKFIKGRYKLTWFYFDQGNISIEYVSDQPLLKDCVLFMGLIKNKSELKVLLKQLGI